jgi:ribosomal protein S12 methylthiotransferase
VLASDFDVVDDFDDADVLVVNTCSFIAEATEESVAVILELAAEWAPAREGRRLVVAGCMPSRYGAELDTEMPEVDAFVPVAEEAAIVEVLSSVTGYSSSRSTECAGGRTVSGPSAYLQISDGCYRNCAYCTIPSIRGPYRSRPLDAILAEAKALVAEGVREIVLIGQDITAYGRDLEEPVVLADVVRALSGLPDLAWLRLMYAQPDGITDELLAAIAESPKVCRYLDMPLQHASKPVLRAMRRTGDGESYLRLVHASVSRAEIVLRTTLIAGFPGEPLMPRCYGASSRTHASTSSVCFPTRPKKARPRPGCSHRFRRAPGARGRNGCVTVPISSGSRKPPRGSGRWSTSSSRVSTSMGVYRSDAGADRLPISMASFCSTAAPPARSSRRVS